jgi:Predicted transcriptional regulators
MRKETSVNFENEQRLLEKCNTVYTVSLIAGRWKPAILWQLIHRPHRYKELKDSLPGITERMLTLSLKEMEKDGLIAKKTIPGFPPQREYTLSDRGRSLEPMLRQMSDWGGATKTGEDGSGLILR